MIRRVCIPSLMMLMGSRQARLLPIHALESKGVNEIPAAMAKLLSEWLGFPVEASIVQANTVGHTGASGFQRLANQACFVGEVERGERYLIVDDFVGQGGTLANLIGYIESQGGHAAGATVLTGKPYVSELGLFMSGARTGGIEQRPGSNGLSYPGRDSTSRPTDQQIVYQKRFPVRDRAFTANMAHWERSYNMRPFRPAIADAAGRQWPSTELSVDSTQSRSVVTPNAFC
jgi:hypothetical protein